MPLTRTRTLGPVRVPRLSLALHQASPHLRRLWLAEGLTRIVWWLGGRVQTPAPFRDAHVAAPHTLRRRSARCIIRTRGDRVMPPIHAP